MLRAPLRSAFLDRLQNTRDDFDPRLHALVAFVVEADADGTRGHVAGTDDEHRVDLRLLGLLNLAVDLVRALLGQAQRRVAITARLRRKNAVVMREVQSASNA